MFGELISFVDLLRSAASDLRARKATAEVEKAILTMLEVHFYLMDAVDEGEALVRDAGPAPIERLAGLSQADAEIKLAEWDVVLRRQAFRLREVSKLVFDQHFLGVLNPDLPAQLNKVVGSKFDRATSLRSIGAALFFRAMLPLDDEPAKRAEYVALMAGDVGSAIDMDRVRAEIASLRGSMEGYQEALLQVASKESIIGLSAAARRSTDLSGDHADA